MSASDMSNGVNGTGVFDEGASPGMIADERTIRSIGDDVEGYKYLGVLEADDIMYDEVKRRMEQYIRRVKKTLS